jgi:orotidine-5'-phosphate decarboxylase
MKNYFASIGSRIIFAADLPTTEENFRVLDKIINDIDVIKLSSFLAISEGVGCIGKFKRRYGKPIFADFKIADVPHTNSKIIKLIKDQGGDAAMVHGIVGPDAIEDCIKAADGQLGIIIQIELTNPGGILFTAPIAEDIAKLAASMEVYGVQAPGNRPDKIKIIRNIIGPEKIIVCCGIGSQGGRYMSAVAAGGTYPIVGRAIYEAIDPKQAIRNLISH